MGFVNLLFSVSGRVNRAKWWLAVVFWSVVWMVAFGAVIVTFAQDIIGMSSDMSSEEALKLLLSWGFAGFLFVLLIVIPMIVSSIFVGIKRLHDRDKSGWWLALFYFGPMVIQGIGGPSTARPWPSYSRSPVSRLRSGAWWSSASCAARRGPINTVRILWRPSRSLRKRPERAHRLTRSPEHR